MLDVAPLVVFFHAAAATLLGQIYFHQYRISRPPIGVINVWDIMLLMAAIVLVPALYLTLASWFVTTLLLIGAAGALFVISEPIFPAGLSRWLAVLALLGTNVGVRTWLGTTSVPSFFINNVVLILITVGIANLWVQSGLRARDAAVLTGFLTIYDGIATSWLPTMTSLMQRLAELPLAPMVGWPVGDEGRWLALGLGDLLIATTFPLVLLKAYGRSAGFSALVLALGGIGGAITLVALEVIQTTLPVMIVLGPLMIATYLVCLKVIGPERTTWQYRQDIASEHRMARNQYHHV